MHNTTDLPLAKTKPASGWSVIWVLPIIALLIGGWLAWRAYSEAGIEVQVRFASGEGIQAGKTELVYKGISVGKVNSVRLDDTGQTRGVIAVLEVDKTLSDSLREGTRFWLVKPSVSLAGISGLETLVSGNYITLSPGQGKPKYHFVALANQPPMDDNVPGLHLTLKAERLGSIHRDSPVFYKQIQAGRVKSFNLADDQSTVEINIFIEPEFAHLVRKHTRFWNASGVSIDASLSGVRLRSESLASIVAGGIAFATPEHRKDSPPTDPSLPFRLYDDYEEAQTGIKISVKLSDFEGLQEGRTPVVYKGLQVGVLKTMSIDRDLSGATAELIMHPRAEEYLLEGAEFWVVKPEISLAGITGLEALVKGNYIAVRPGDKDGKPTREFVARSKAPPLDLGAPGLHLVLTSDQLGSIAVGSPVMYRQIQVGSVQSYQLTRSGHKVVIGVHIEPDYQRLINDSTRFWNASGITLKGGLSGVEVKSESLQTLLNGGIAFETPDLNATRSAKLVQHFTLHPDHDIALQSGQMVRIKVRAADGLAPGAPVRYKGIEVGQVETLTLTEDLQAVMLGVRISQAVDAITRERTQFWVVKPQVSLTRAEHLETLVTGPYLQVQPGRSGAKRVEFEALEKAPDSARSEQGLALTLSTARRGSIKAGTQVTYREIAVGVVTGVRLGHTADRVLIDVLIEPRYAPLVRTGSRFWNASGIGVDASLFRGVKVRTESLEALLEGGIAFATPDNAEMGAQALPGQTFALFDELEERWLNWAPKIPLQ